MIRDAALEVASVGPHLLLNLLAETAKPDLSPLRRLLELGEQHTEKDQADEVAEPMISVVLGVAHDEATVTQQVLLKHRSRFVVESGGIGHEEIAPDPVHDSYGRLHRHHPVRADERRVRAIPIQHLRHPLTGIRRICHRAHRGHRGIGQGFDDVTASTQRVCHRGHRGH